jgi:ABC-2 type transport system permease protein
MRVLTIARKDLTEVVRDRRAAIFLVLMPLLFTLFFGFFFKAEEHHPAAGYRIGWCDRDPEGFLSARLRSLLDSSESVRLVVLGKKDGEVADKLVHDGKFAAVLVIPSGFSSSLAEGRIAESPKLGLIAAQGTPGGQTAIAAVQGAAGKLIGALEISRLSLEFYEKNKPVEDAGVRKAYLEESLGLAMDAWKDPSLTVAIEAAPKGGAQAPRTEQLGGYNQASPGMIVQFAIFGLISSASVLVLERRSRALQRMLTTPMRRAEIIAGHTLAMFVLMLVLQTVLIGVGQLALGVNYLRVPGATLLMIITLGLWSASLGLLISALSRHEQQVVMFSLIAMFVFSALGGAWFPLETAGRSFARVGHFLPTAWAMDGFQNIILRGLGFGSVLLPAAVLLGCAGLFFGLAVWRFKYE